MRKALVVLGAGARAVPHRVCRAAPACRTDRIRGAPLSGGRGPDVVGGACSLDEPMPAVAVVQYSTPQTREELAAGVRRRRPQPPHPHRLLDQGRRRRVLDLLRGVPAGPERRASASQPGPARVQLRVLQRADRAVPAAGSATTCRCSTRKVLLLSPAQAEIGYPAWSPYWSVLSGAVLTRHRSGAGARGVPAAALRLPVGGQCAARGVLSRLPCSGRRAELCSAAAAGASARMRCERSKRPRRASGGEQVFPDEPMPDIQVQEYATPDNRADLADACTDAFEATVFDRPPTTDELNRATWTCWTGFLARPGRRDRLPERGAARIRLRVPDPPVGAVPAQPGVRCAPHSSRILLR